MGSTAVRVRLSNLCFFAYPYTSSGKGYTDKVVDDYDCATDGKGYKQLNTVLSLAFQTILKDGRYRKIVEYNAGFPGGSYSSAYITEFDSCDAYWDRAETPVGILANIISTGKMKWCVYGSRSAPAFGVAESDNFLQGIEAGDYFGTFVDRFDALTYTMSDILHAPIVPEYVVVPVVDGFFDDMAAALADGSCYGTLDLFFRHPYREEVVDFTCKTRNIDQGFGVQALASTDLSRIIPDQGEGYSICTLPGSTQAALVARDFPEATLVEVGSIEAMTGGVCAGLCDAVVDSLAAIPGFLLSEPDCEGVEFGEAQQIANPSSAGDVGAITYRPPICH